MGRLVIGIVAVVSVAGACTSSRGAGGVRRTRDDVGEPDHHHHHTPTTTTLVATTLVTTTTTTAPPSTRPPSTTTTTTTTTSPPRLVVPGIARGVSDSVVRLHLGLLRRPPSPAELRAGVERYRETGSFEGLTATVLASTEYLARRRTSAPDHIFVRSLYADVLGRRPDPPGAESWQQNLSLGMSRPAVAAAFVQSPEAVLHTGTAAPTAPPPPRGGSRRPGPRHPPGACSQSAIP